MHYGIAHYRGEKPVRIRKNALLLFSKPPIAGLVKTRLTVLKDGIFEPEVASGLYHCMLFDVAEICCDALAQLEARQAASEGIVDEYELIISTTPQKNVEVMQRIFDESGQWPRNISIICDEGASFDEHYNHAFEQVFAMGFDTILSMVIGWAINSAMILLAAATFFVSKTPVTELQQADSLLRPLLGNNATIIFAVALLFAGIASTITSGMAAGSIFAGMFKEPYDIKDTHSRTGVVISLIVAFVIIIAISNPFKGLIYSQMALSIQLPVTVFTQVYLTSSEKVMGKFRNSTYTKYLLYTIGVIVTVLNLMLLWSCL